MLSRPFVEQATQEAVGPLVPGVKIAQISKTYFTRHLRRNMSKDATFRNTENAIEQFANEAIEKAKASLAAVARPVSLSTRVNAHDSDTTMALPGEFKDNTKRVPTMNEAYHEARKDFSAFFMAKKEIAKRADFNKEQKKRHQAKAKGGKIVLSNIMKLLELEEFEERGTYYKKEFAWLFECAFNEKGNGKFSIPVVEGILGKLVRAPTTTTEEKIILSIRALFKKLAVLETTGFLGDWEYSALHFLSDDCPLEVAIEAFCVQFLSSRELLLRPWSSEVWSNIERRDFKNALFTAIHSGQNRRASSDTDLYWIICWGLPVEYIEHHYTESEDRFVSFFNLASTLWDRQHRTYGFFWSYASFKDFYFRVRQTFRDNVEKISMYLANEDTRNFLAEQGPPSHAPDQTFTRKEAIDTIYELVGPTQSHLFNGDFRRLLQLHRAIFENPRKYGYDPWTPAADTISSLDL
jgi:hypothetical protein